MAKLFFGKTSVKEVESWQMSSPTTGGVSPSAGPFYSPSTSPSASPSPSPSPEGPPEFSGDRGDKPSISVTNSAISITGKTGSLYFDGKALYIKTDTGFEVIKGGRSQSKESVQEEPVPNRKPKRSLEF
jgi:hypothetical protein